jgi:hypothetical protein
MRQPALGMDCHVGDPARTRGTKSVNRRIAMILTAFASLLACWAMAASAQAEVATYSAIETVPVPPASNFAGSGGGDGWAVALSSTAVYNVFHHNGSLQVACHLQTTAAPCYEPETITDSEGHGFSTSGHPGMYLDQRTGKLYVYATRTSDETAGVVCFDTNLAPTNPDPFCGFTALSGTGEGPVQGISTVSIPMLIGTHWYSFNYANGTPSGTKDELMCFDVNTDTPCAGQPFAVSLGAGEVTDGSFPSPATAAIGSKVMIPIAIGGVNRLACFDDATQGGCAGAWPVTLATTNYASVNGAPFPLLSGSGQLQGLCIPTGTDECFDLNGTSVPTPAGMPAVIGASDGWNGPALVLGPRIYVPNGNVGEGIVQCFDYATGASCANFPKEFKGLGYLYTVNADPQRPTCIWVNSDDGESQIQDFDAYTGQACGQGVIRVLASQFVVPAPQCTPASYVSVQILQPARASYASGSVAFNDGDGNSIPGLGELALDATGTASLAGLSLNTATGLPQFLFTFSGENGPVGSVEVKLTWTGDYNAACAGAGITVNTTPAPKPQPKGGVAAFGVAHLASRPQACVASSSYLASVSGKLIASVTFTVDGHKVKRLTKPNSHGRYTARIAVRAGHKEKLVVHVVYSSASKTHTATLRRTLARCAVHHAPRFTG